MTADEIEDVATTEDTHANVAACATKRVSHQNQLRRWAVSDAIGYLLGGDPQGAYDRLIYSVLGEQARAAGIRVEA